MEDKYVHAKRKRPNAGNGLNFLSQQVKAQAAQGKFAFDKINGFTLTEVEYKMPPKQTRVNRREEFKREVRPKFLKYLAENFEQDLRAIGIGDEGLEQMRKGRSVNGYNVHHMHPIAGGGKNDFSNLILMPNPPHDELHHLVIDPQIKDKKVQNGLKIKIPMCNDRVWKRPANKYERLNTTVNAAVLAKQMQGGR